MTYRHRRQHTRRRSSHLALRTSDSSEGWRPKRQCDLCSLDSTETRARDWLETESASDWLPREPPLPLFSLPECWKRHFFSVPQICAPAVTERKELSISFKRCVVARNVFSYLSKNGKPGPNCGPAMTRNVRLTINESAGGRRRRRRRRGEALPTLRGR